MVNRAEMTLLRLLARRRSDPPVFPSWDPPLPGNIAGWWLAGLLCLTGMHTQQCQNYGLCPRKYRCRRPSV